MTNSNAAITRQEAEAMIRAGFGDEQLRIVCSYICPIWWSNPTVANAAASVRNGTALFLDTGERVFGVTAAHVVNDGYKLAKLEDPAVYCKLNDLEVALEHRIIDIDFEIDIATFEIGPAEIATIGARAFPSASLGWPPLAAQQGSSVLLAGYPGRLRVLQRRQTLRFELLTALGIATSVSEKDVCYQIEREHVVDRGNVPAAGFDMGGVSGGILAVPFNRNGELFLQLGGVIYQGSNGQHGDIPGLEVLRARRAHFIRADGTLDKHRWNSLKYP